ncbi:hypothetical protein [Stenotrophomonas phage RAS14]
MKEKILPNKEPLSTTDKATYADFIAKNLPSTGSQRVDERMDAIKSKLFMDLFELAETSGASYDSEIVFDNLMEDCRNLFYQVSPSLRLIEQSKDR